MPVRVKREGKEERWGNTFFVPIKWTSPPIRSQCTPCKEHGQPLHDSGEERAG